MCDGPRTQPGHRDFGERAKQELDGKVVWKWKTPFHVEIIVFVCTVNTFDREVH